VRDHLAMFGNSNLLTLLHLGEDSGQPVLNLAHRRRLHVNIMSTMREQASMLRILWKWSYAVATNPIAAFLSSFLAAQTTARFERNVRRMSPFDCPGGKLACWPGPRYVSGLAAQPPP